MLEGGTGWVSIFKPQANHLAGDQKTDSVNWTFSGHLKTCFRFVQPHKMYTQVSMRVCISNCMYYRLHVHIHTCRDAHVHTCKLQCNVHCIAVHHITLHHATIRRVTLCSVSLQDVILHIVSLPSYITSLCLALPYLTLLPIASIHYITLHDIMFHFTNFKPFDLTISRGRVFFLISTRGRKQQALPGSCPGQESEQKEHCCPENVNSPYVFFFFPPEPA